MKRPQVLFLVLAVLLFLFATVGFWLSRTIYNPQNFSTLVVQTYEQQDVRNAISTAIVDNTLESRPLAKRVLDDPIKSALSGILGSQTFSNTLGKLAERFQKYLTTNNREDITIEVGQYAPIIKSIATAISPELGAQIPDVAPQTITLVRSDSLPNINQWLKPIMTFGPIAGIISILLLVYIIYKEENRPALMKRIGIYFLVGSIAMGLLIIYLRAILQGNVADQNLQVIVTETYNTFARVLARQLSFIAIIAIVIYSIGFYLSRPHKEITE